MKKTFFSLLLLLSQTAAVGQITNLKGSWISPERDFMRIDTSHTTAQSYLATAISGDRSFLVVQQHDTLRFLNQYHSSATNFKILHVERYDLKIRNQTPTTLDLQPASPLAHSFFSNRPLIRFTRQEAMVDSSIRLDKLIFHSSFSAFGTHPAYQLEVSKNKKARLFVNRAYSIRNQNDSTRQTYYKGTLTDSVYARLVRAVQTAGLRAMARDEVQCCDGIVVTLIVRYNQYQRYYYRTMSVPMAFQELLDTLYAICRTNAFTPSKEAFTLEH